MRLAALALLAGCSLTMARLPADYDVRVAAPRCETHASVPTLDTALAAAAVGAGTGLVIGDVGNRALVGLAAAVVGVLFETSAIYGFQWNADCRAAQVQWGPRAPVDTSVRGAIPVVADPPDPTDDPARASAYWCGEGSRCVADRARCAGATCAPRRDVWCAVTDDGFVCGRDRGGCIEAGATVHLRGDCIARRAEKWHPAELAPVLDPK